MRLARPLLWLLPPAVAALVVWTGRHVDPAFYRPPAAAAPSQSISFPPALGAWRAHDPAWFPRERIYEKIDGRDVLFLQYGVENLHCVTWRGTSDWDMYLYTMREPAGAQGVWQAEKPATAAVLGSGDTWLTSDAAAAHHGRWYLYLSATRVAPARHDATNLLALLRAHLPLPPAPFRDPASLLPAAGREHGSQEYLPQDAFGFSSLSNVHAARYSLANAPATYFVTLVEDAPAAAALVARYTEEFLHIGGSQVFHHADGFTGVLFDQWERVAFSNELVYGVREADSFTTLTQHWENFRLHLSTHSPQPIHHAR